MKYIKADDVIPEELLHEIQKYIFGEMVYIPKPEGIRKKWGEVSGGRAYLDSRNKQIRAMYREGASIEHLSAIFCLSYESIRKIVYSD